MALNVKFLEGLAIAYTGLAAKDQHTFYYTTDDKNLYLGEIKLSNAADLAAAITRIATNESDIDEIQAELSALVGGDEGQSIQDMIDTSVNAAKTELQGQIGTLTSLNTTAKDNVVAAINEALTKISEGDTAKTITLETPTAAEGMAKTYTLKQGTTTIGTINIPKDMVVQSGAVETDPAGQAPGTYIVLTLANATSDKIYVNVGTLVDIYTAAQSAAQVQLAISGHEISATIVAGSVTATELANNAVTTVKIADGNVTEAKLAAGAITEGKLGANAVTTAKIADANVTKAKLDATVQASLGKADTAIQADDVVEGATNGTIAVDGADVPVHGLGSAAYTESNAYDAAGSASQAETNAKAYVDTALTWGAIE